MTGFWTVFTTELRRRRLAFVVAAAAGFVPFLLALLFTETAPAAEVRAITALVGGAGLSALLALLLGGSMLGSEAVEGRLAFWLARPVALPGLWLGRYLAGLAISLGSGVLVLLPSMVAAGGPETLLRHAAFYDAGAFGQALLGAAVLLGVGHVIVVGSRDRSGWSVLDLAALLCLPLLVGLAWWLILRRGSLHWTQAQLVQEPFGNWTLLVILGAVLAASALFLLRGRLDLRRGHRAMALTLAGVLLPFTVWHQVNALYPPAPDLGELNVFTGLSTSPDGRWVSVHGFAPKHSHSGQGHGFLLSTGDGEPLHLGRAAWIPPVFSRDGSTAVWVESTLDGPLLQRIDLTTDPPVVKSLGNLGEPWPRDLALSPSGTWAAVISDGRMEVIDLVREQTLGTYRGIHDQDSLVFFPDDDRLRLYSGPQDNVQTADGVEIFELDLASPEKTLRRTGLIEGTSHVVSVEPEESGERVLVVAQGPDKDGPDPVSLRSGLTGEILSEVGSGSAGYSDWALFLREGSIAYLEGDRGKDWRLHLLSPAGEPTAEIELPHTMVSGILAQASTGEILLHGLTNIGGDEVRWTLDAVDPVTGDLRTLGHNLRIGSAAMDADALIGWQEKVLSSSGPPEIFALERGRGLLRLNLRTGEQKLVAGNALHTEAGSS